MLVDEDDLQRPVQYIADSYIEDSLYRTGSEKGGDNFNRGPPNGHLYGRLSTATPFLGSHYTTRTTDRVFSETTQKKRTWRMRFTLFKSWGGFHLGVLHCVWRCAFACHRSDPRLCCCLPRGFTCHVTVPSAGLYLTSITGNNCYEELAVIRHKVVLHSFLTSPALPLVYISFMSPLEHPGPSYEAYLQDPLDTLTSHQRCTNAHRRDFRGTLHHVLRSPRTGEHQRRHFNTSLHEYVT